MKPVWSASDVDVYVGDSRTAWQHLPENCADAIVTSPPYWGLRDYGVDGQIGLEATPQEYIDGLADLLTGYTRQLKRGGSLWLNLGDTFSADRSYQVNQTRNNGPQRRASNDFSMKAPAGFPPKCLLMIPERVALALIARGWILRNKVAWVKPNGMPSSVKDRLATKWEYLFHLTREPRYAYDLDAIRESFADKTLHAYPNGPGGNRPPDSAYAGNSQSPRGLKNAMPNPAGANPGDWWVIPTQPYPGAHYAVFPPELIRRPVLATVPEQVCKACGAGRERIESGGAWTFNPSSRPQQQRAVEIAREKGWTPARVAEFRKYGSSSVATDKAGGYGWSATARADADELVQAFGGYAPDIIRALSRGGGTRWTDCGCDIDPKWSPGTVLDPFIGSGTTAQVARRFGRRCIGVDLDGSNVPLIQERLGGGQDVLDIGGVA